MAEIEKAPRRKQDGLVEKPMDVLERLNDGATLPQLMEELHFLTSAVVTLGKSGTVTLTITTKPGKKSGAVKMTGKVTSNIPRPDAEETTFFAREDGTLSVQPFDQAAIPFKVETA